MRISDIRWEYKVTEGAIFLNGYGLDRKESQHYGKELEEKRTLGLKSYVAGPGNPPMRLLAATFVTAVKPLDHSTYRSKRVPLMTFINYAMLRGYAIQGNTPAMRPTGRSGRVSPSGMRISPRIIVAF